MIYRIDGVRFDLDLAISILKAKRNYTETDFLESIRSLKSQYIKKEITYEECAEKWNKLEKIKPEEIFKLENADQRMVAISSYGVINLLGSLKHEIIDEIKLVKKNKRLDFTYRDYLENVKIVDQIKEIEYEYEDVYTYIKIELETGRETVEIRGVKCFCPSTGREYFLYVTPTKEHWGKPSEYPETALEALCTTFRINVKEEAIDYIYRQGDVIICILKEDHEKDWQCDPRCITPQEYLTKLQIES